MPLHLVALRISRCCFSLRRLSPPALQSPVRQNRTYHVYMLASDSGTLYTGMTNNLLRRVLQHKSGKIPGFTQKYHVTKLVWFEPHTDPKVTIAREKQIKRWRRDKRVALIESENPQWQDLSEMLR